MRKKKFRKESVCDERGNILIGKFSDYLIQEYNIVTINNQINMYKDGTYVPGEKVIEKSMLDYFPNMKQSQRKEVLSQILLKTEECDDMNKNLNLIAFRNGVYNLATRELQPFSKEYIIPNKINWDYNPSAKSKDVDSLLDKISCHDPEIRSLMEEMIGYSMYRSLEKQVAFILVGSEGSNGKSTYTKILNHLLGVDNISSRDLSDFSNDKFASADLFGKLANVGDDISGEYISDPSMFKSLSAGERIAAQRKFGQPFNFAPYATHIYSANRIPKVKDADGGVKRRMKIIPFNALFKPTDPDFDPTISQRIMFGGKEVSADESMSYIINLAIAGLHRVLENNFTVSQKCLELIEEYDKDCNPTLEWCEEYLGEQISFDMEKRDSVYNNYKLWAENSGQKPLSKIALVRFINERYHTKVEPKYHYDIGKTVRTFVIKE